MKTMAIPHTFTWLFYTHIMKIYLTNTSDRGRLGAMDDIRYMGQWFNAQFESDEDLHKIVLLRT